MYWGFVMKAQSPRLACQAGQASKIDNVPIFEAIWTWNKKSDAYFRFRTNLARKVETSLIKFLNTFRGSDKKGCGFDL